MTPMHDTETTGEPQKDWMESGMVALARRTIGRMALALASATRPARSTGMSPCFARRIDPPPFADTEASWHRL